MNVLSDIPKQLSDELTQTIVTAQNVRIERIVSTGQCSANDFWYDQPEHEWVVVLQGSARLEFADRTKVDLAPGDSITIPAHRRHRVDWTAPDEPTIWLAVFYRD